jgi:hypothetical protein
MTSLACTFFPAAPCWYASHHLRLTLLEVHELALGALALDLQLVEVADDNHRILNGINGLLEEAGELVGQDLRLLGV